MAKVSDNNGTTKIAVSSAMVNKVGPQTNHVTRLVGTQQALTPWLILTCR